MAIQTVSTYNPCDMPGKWKDRVREELAVYVARSGQNITQVAKSIGVNRDLLYNLNSKGSMNAEDLRRLEEWLEEHGPGELAARAAMQSDSFQPAIQFAACPECGEETPKIVKGRPALFCVHCGTSLGRECQACGHLNIDSTAKYCNGCGAPLTEAANIEAHGDESAIERMTMTSRERRQRKQARRQQRIKDGKEIDY